MGEVKHQDNKIEEVNKTVAVIVKMLEEQLTKGLKIAKLQRELHEIIQNFEMHRLKTVFPLCTVNFEQILKLFQRTSTKLANYMSS